MHSITSRCVPDVCQQEVATLVVNNGSGTSLLVLLVFMHLGCVPGDCRQVQLWLMPLIMQKIVWVIQLARCGAIVASCHRSWGKSRR